jgi:hypothetical protein
LKLGVRRQALQDHGLKGARGDGEVQRVPDIVAPDGGVELEGERVVARFLKRQDVAAALGSDAPVWMTGQLGKGGIAGEEGQRAAARIEHARGGGEDEGGVLLGERADELEIAQHDLACLGIGRGDVQRECVGRAVELEGQRFRGVGGRLRAHGLGQILCLERAEAGRRPGLDVQLRRGFDLHEAAEECGLGRGERENIGRHFQPSELAFGNDGDDKLRERFLGLHGAQDESLHATGLLADAPVLQEFAAHLLDLTFTRHGQREFLRDALQHGEGSRDGVNDFDRRNLDGVL